jgi:6-pyruvoyltetrahydropterin/6-carboxytetrahydropterin synthase
MFKFDAAHWLPEHEGKCKNLHGHTWKIEIEVSGELLSTGMIMDFSDLKRLVTKQVLDYADHQCLNDLPFTLMQNPTAENLCEWIRLQVGTSLPDEIVILRVRVWESDEAYAEWRYQ